MTRHFPYKFGTYEEAAEYMRLARAHYKDNIHHGDQAFYLAPDPGGWTVFCPIGRCRIRPGMGPISLKGLRFKSRKIDDHHDSESRLISAYWDELSNFNGDIDWLEAYQSGCAHPPSHYEDESD